MQNQTGWYIVGVLYIIILCSSSHFMHRDLGLSVVFGGRSRRTRILINKPGNI
jgi:hypothetical protein